MSAISLIRWLETKTVRPSDARRRRRLAHPADPVGVEPVHRLVEQQHARITEQRFGDAETLAHAEREVARQLLGDRGQSDEVEHLVDAASRDVVRLGQHPKVRVGAPTGMDRLRLEERADLAKRPGEIVVVTTIDRDRAGVRSVEAHDQAHRRRLPRPVRTEEPRHVTGLHVEAQIVDGDLVAVALGEASSLDRVLPLPGTVLARRGCAAVLTRCTRTSSCRRLRDDRVRLHPAARPSGSGATSAERSRGRRRVVRDVGRARECCRDEDEGDHNRGDDEHEDDDPQPVVAFRTAKLEDRTPADWSDVAILPHLASVGDDPRFRIALDFGKLIQITDAIRVVFSM